MRNAQMLAQWQDSDPRDFGFGSAPASFSPTTGESGLKFNPNHD